MFRHCSNAYNVKALHESPIELPARPRRPLPASIPDSLSLKTVSAAPIPASGGPQGRRVIGVVMMPGRLLTDFSAFGSPCDTGAARADHPSDYCGIFWRRAQRQLLVHPQRGISTASICAEVSRAAGIAVALLGCFAGLVPAVRCLYDCAWFVGFGVSGAMYVMLIQRAEAPVWEGES